MLNLDENLICVIPESILKYKLIYCFGRSLTFLCDTEKHNPIRLKSQYISPLILLLSLEPI